MVKYLNRLAGVALSIDRTIRTPEHCFSQKKAAGMTYICRLTQQLASLWFPLHKGFGICQLDYEILQKMSSVVNTSLVVVFSLFLKDKSEIDLSLVLQKTYLTFYSGCWNWPKPNKP